MRSHRWRIWGVVVTVLAVGAYLAVRSRRAVEVEAATIQRGALAITINEAATTRVRKRVDVTASVTGRFVPADIAVGDTVVASTVIGTLYPAPLDRVGEIQARRRLDALSAAAAAARTRVETAHTASANAMRDAQRAQRLFEAGAIAQRDVDQARMLSQATANDLLAAREHVREVEAERASAEAIVAALDTDSRAAVHVTATIRGRVLRRYEENPRVVVAGTPLAQIGDPRTLEAVIPVLSADAPRISIGAVVRYLVGARSDTVTGHVKRIEPAAFTKYSSLGVEEQRVNVIATVADTLGKLGDQYRLDARITVWQTSDAVLVPTSALFRDGDSWAVFVVRAGRARRVRVELGERAVDAALVRDGLAVDDQVIVYPDDTITDGLRVKVAVQ
jgi:HlyD family secretion protein